MAGEDRDFVAWVRQQSCMACAELEERQTTRTEADHAGDRALGRKAHDRTCIPLCTNHHRDRHDCRGFFSERMRNRAWLELAMCETNRLYGAAQGISVF